MPNYSSPRKTMTGVVAKGTPSLGSCSMSRYLAIVPVLILVVACGGAATPTLEPTATVRPTPTSEPTATPRPTPASTPEPPATAVDPGPGTEYLSPSLWALLQRHANGDTSVADTVDVHFWFHFEQVTTQQQVIATMQQIVTDAGGSATSSGAWRVPTERLLSLVQMPEVTRAELADEEPDAGGLAARGQKNTTLQHVVQAYEGGVPASAAIQYALFIDGNHRMFVTIESNSAEDDDNVRQWLRSNDIYTPPSQYALTGGYTTLAMLSVPNTIALADKYPTISLSAEDFEGQGLPLSRGHWPQEALDFEQASIDAVLEAEQATGAGTTEPVENPELEEDASGSPSR